MEENNKEEWMEDGLLDEEILDEEDDAKAEAYREFKGSLINKKKGKKSKIRESAGSYYFYKWIRKNHWLDIGRNLKEHEYYSIIRGVNNLIAEEIGKGNTVTLPSRMGTLELRKYNVGAKMVNGHLRVTYPIDWESTIRLWFEDEEAKKKKVLVRFENGTMYNVKYNKYKANYNNKSFYQFTLNRNIRRALARNINNGSVDTMYIGK